MNAKCGNSRFFECVLYTAGSSATITNAALAVVDLIPYFFKYWSPYVVGISDGRHWLTRDSISPANVM